MPPLAFYRALTLSLVHLLSGFVWLCRLFLTMPPCPPYHRYRSQLRGRGDASSRRRGGEHRNCGQGDEASRDPPLALEPLQICQGAGREPQGWTALLRVNRMEVKPEGWLSCANGQKWASMRAKEDSFRFVRVLAAARVLVSDMPCIVQPLSRWATSAVKTGTPLTATARPCWCSLQENLCLLSFHWKPKVGLSVGKERVMPGGEEGGAGGAGQRRGPSQGWQPSYFFW